MTKCDACRQPADRLATIGKGDSVRRLCPDCTNAALIRDGDADWRKAARRLEQKPDWQEVRR